MSTSQRRDKLALLHEEIAKLHAAGEHLAWSMQRCQTLIQHSPWSAEDLERLESLASRFARFADLLTQRLMRLADDLELDAPGSLLDRIRRAEKRGWVNQDGRLVRIREIRNLIAHEYEDAELAELYRAILEATPDLLAVIPHVQSWATRIH